MYHFLHNSASITAHSREIPRSAYTNAGQGVTIRNTKTWWLELNRPSSQLQSLLRESYCVLVATPTPFPWPHEESIRKSCEGWPTTVTSPTGDLSSYGPTHMILLRPRLWRFLLKPMIPGSVLHQQAWMPTATWLPMSSWGASCQKHRRAGT